MLLRFVSVLSGLCVFVKTPACCYHIDGLNKLRPRKMTAIFQTHDDVIKWKHFPRNWSFVRGIHWSPVNSPHKGQWRGALMFSLICAWINAWVNNREAGDFRRNRAHYDVSVMQIFKCIFLNDNVGISIQIALKNVPKGPINNIPALF